MTFDTYEYMAATASLSVYLGDVADGHALMPYQGAKWRIRRELEALAKEYGGFAKEDFGAAHLNDLGPWGRVWGVLIDPVLRAGVLAVLEDSLAVDPKELFASLHGAKLPENDVLYAAQYLWLQRLSFGNKSVSARGGKWSSPGLNESSAYGKDATEKFGKISPMIPSLIARLRGYDWDRTAGWTATQRPASADLLPKTAKRKLVLIDPSYEGKTGYPLDVQLSRVDVAGLAADTEDRLFSGMIIVTEAEPIEELLEAGWHKTRLTVARHHDGSSMKGKHEEWATWISKR